MRRASALALCSLLTAAVPAFAQVTRAEEIEQRRTSEYGVCVLGEPADAEMRACAEAELRRQDVTLNAEYQAALRRLNARQQQRLRAAQRAWVAWRNAGCAAELNEDEAARLQTAQCRVDMTIGRTIDLEGYGD